VEVSPRTVSVLSGITVFSCHARRRRDSRCDRCGLPRTEPGRVGPGTRRARRGPGRVRRPEENSRNSGPRRRGWCESIPGDVGTVCSSLCGKPIVAAHMSDGYRPGRGISVPAAAESVVGSVVAAATVRGVAAGLGCPGGERMRAVSRRPARPPAPQGYRRLIRRCGRWRVVQPSGPVPIQVNPGRNAMSTM
jgi:hypothetical protein